MDYREVALPAAYRMLKKAPNFVLITHCTKPGNGYPSNPSTYETVRLGVLTPCGLVGWPF